MFGIKVEPEDWLEIARLRARWADLAYTTARADRPRAEAAIIAMYGAAGYGPPKKITWVESPAALVSAMPKRSILMGRGESRYADVINSQLKKLVCDIIAGPDKPLFWDFAQGYFTARRDTWARRVRRLADITQPWPIGGRGRLGRPNLFVPDVNAVWDLALLEFFGRRMRKPQRQLLRPHLELARYAHWMVPQRNSCLVMDRPTRINLDEVGHFHCEDGPALAYGEDSKLWVWHGTVVPQAAITDPARIGLSAIGMAPRETAYAMIERMGSERFIRKFGALKSHEDETGVLWRRSMVSVPEGLWVWSCVQVKNGTPAPDGRIEEFFLTVPAHVTTAREAVAWTYGMSAAEYDIAVRT